MILRVVKSGIFAAFALALTGHGALAAPPDKPLIFLVSGTTVGTPTTVYWRKDNGPNGGTQWRLLSNNAVLGTTDKFEQSLNGASGVIQLGSVSYPFTSPNTYSVSVSLCNTDGCTASDPKPVVITAP